MIRRIFFGSLITLAIAVAFVVANPSRSNAAAVAPPPASGACQTSSSSFLGFPTWYKYLDQDTPVAGKCTLIFNFPGDIAKVVLALVEILLRVAGLVAVGYIVYGGFQFILSQGDAGAGNVPKTTIARHTVQNALIGLVIAMLATFIVRLIGNTLI